MIDVHTHFFPTGLPDLGDGPWPHLEIGDDGAHGLIRCGAEPFRPVDRRCWDVEARLEDAAVDGIDLQVLSPVPISLTYWADSGPATTYAKAMNNALAAAVDASAGRCVGLGTIPLQDVDAALGELERVGALGLHGVEIGTVVGGRELDDDALAPFFEAAASSGVPIFVHPVDSGVAIRRKGPLYDFGVGMLADTAMSATALVFGGVLDRWPDLRIALAHGCGAFPWTYPRTRYLAAGRHGADPARCDELVRSLWVDSLVFDEDHLPLLGARFGYDHVMLGSDHPFLPRALGRPTDVIDRALERSICSAADAARMRGANAVEFLGLDLAPPG